MQNRILEENYKKASIVYLKEIYNQENTKSEVLKRKKDISRSSDYNEGIALHEFHKKLIEYLVIAFRSSDTDAHTFSRLQSRLEGRTEGKLETYMELIHDRVISVEEAARRLNISVEELEMYV